MGLRNQEGTKMPTVATLPGWTYKKPKISGSG